MLSNFKENVKSTGRLCHLVNLPSVQKPFIRCGRASLIRSFVYKLFVYLIEKPDRITSIQSSSHFTSIRKACIRSSDSMKFCRIVFSNLHVRQPSKVLLRTGENSLVILPLAHCSISRVQCVIKRGHLKSVGKDSGVSVSLTWSRFQIV